MGKKSKRIRAKITAAPAPASSNVLRTVAELIADVEANWREKLERERPNNVAALVEGIFTRWRLNGVNLSLQASHAALAECQRLESSLYSCLRTAYDLPLYIDFFALMKAAPPSVPGIVEGPAPAHRVYNEIDYGLDLWKESLFERRNLFSASLALRYLLSFPPERHGKARAILLAAWDASLTRDNLGGVLAEDMLPLLSPFLDKHAKRQIRRTSEDDSEHILCRALAMIVRSSIAKDPRIEFVAPKHAPTTEEAYCLRRACNYIIKMEPEDWNVDNSKLETLITIDRDALTEAVVTRLKSISGCEIVNNMDFHSFRGTAALIHHSKSVGGMFCDACRQQISPYRQSFALLSCSRCRLAHYCSAECQRIAWEGGHNVHCTPFGLFAKGDAAILQRLDGDERKLNGTIVQIIDEVGHGLYSVMIPDIDELRVETIRRKNLRHIRPAA